MSKTGRFFTRKRICGIVLCALLCMASLAGCGEKDKQRTAPLRDVITTEVASVTTVATDGIFDEIQGVYAQGDHFLAVGTKNSGIRTAQVDLQGGLTNVQEIVKPSGTDEHALAYGTANDGSLLIVWQTPVRTAQDEAVALLARYDADGEMTEVTEVADVERTYYGVMEIADGQYLLWNDLEAVVLQGGKTLRTALPPEGSNLMSFAKDADNRCYAIVYYYGSLGVCTYDPANGTYGSVSTFRGFIRSMPMHVSAKSGAIYGNAGDFLYEYDPVTAEWTERFGWNAVSLDGEALCAMAETDAHHFACVFEDDPAIRLISTEIQEVERQIVTIGAVGERLVQLDRLVALFNSRNETYYAVVSYYEEPTLLYADLVTDDAPDLLEITNVQMPLTSDKFADILLYLDADETIGREDLVEGLLHAQMVDDHLTSIAASAWLMTLVGLEQDVGSTPGWTLAELKQIASQLEEGRRIFPEWMTSEELLRWMATVGMGRFIDWDTMTCDFTGQEFIDLLSFCAEMPVEVDESTYVSDFDEHVLVRVWPIQRLLLLENLKVNFGGQPYTLIGFPDDSGGFGSFFEPAAMEVMFAIPLRARQKEGAWEVIREMLSPDYQETVTFFPINRHVMEQGAQELLQDPKLHITQEDIDKAMEVINRTEIFVHYHQLINDIIMEEGMYYLYGEKSAGEVARLIQSRISLYLEEQR